jgi:preprotein translocase subunit SecA
LKEESVGFLFNVQVEAAPAPAVAPVAVPEGLAELAASAAANAQDGGSVATKQRQPAPAALRAKGIEEDEQQLTYTGPSLDSAGPVERRADGNGAPAGVSAGGTRRERREAARRQAREAKSARRR